MVDPYLAAARARALALQRFAHALRAFDLAALDAAPVRLQPLICGTCSEELGVRPADTSKRNGMHLV